MVDFIGLGTQKAGTSWLYACLYEHPEVCAPVKELHFFSRPRYEQGVTWYETHFANCAAGTVVGEFSTSYLLSSEAPARIRAHYPAARLIAVVRNPLDRAYSHYRNAIKTGEIAAHVSYDVFLAQAPTAKAHGRYAEQLARYRAHFPREQLLVLVYEDIVRDPAAVVRQVYEHIGVAPDFTPSQLTASINVARTPKVVWLDTLLQRTAEGLRRAGLDGLVWRVKTSGLTDWLRAKNTQANAMPERPAAVERALAAYYHDDVVALSNLLGRDLVTEWQL